MILEFSEFWIEFGVGEFEIEFGRKFWCQNFKKNWISKFRIIDFDFDSRPSRKCYLIIWSTVKSNQMESILSLVWYLKTPDPSSSILTFLCLNSEYHVYSA